MNVKLVAVSGLLLAVLLELILAGYAGMKLRTRTAKPYILVLVSVVFYSLGYALRLWGSAPDFIFMGIRIVYIGAVSLGPFWLILALSYSGYDRLLNRYLLIALFFIPLITLIMVNTNDLHHLFYTGIDFYRKGPFLVSRPARGPWHAVHIVYNSVTMACGTTVYLIMALRSSGYYRKQALLMFLTSILPWTGYLFYRLGGNPYGIDYTPFLLSLAAPLFSIFLFRFRFFDLIPIARGLVFETMDDPVIVLDTENLLMDWNHQASAFFSWETDTHLQGCPAEEVFSGLEPLRNQLKSGAGAKVEIVLGEGEGCRHFRSRLLPIHSRSGSLIGKALILQDITLEKERMDRLQYMASTDALTGIYNRWMFLEICGHELKRNRRNKTSVSMLMIDLDHFKRVNDTCGHSAGDLVLREVARCLRENLRSSDILARYGGEEFVILLPETGREGALTIAGKYCRTISRLEISFQGTILSVTASIGISTSPDSESESLDSLLERADKALYAAKKEGRNCFMEFPAAAEKEPLMPGIIRKK